MRALSVLVVICVACGRSAPPGPLPPTADVLAAYNARAFRRCADLAVQRGERTRGLARGEAYFLAATCETLAGDRDAAFAWLERAVAGGVRDVPGLEREPDLAPLRADPRWAPWLARNQQQVARWEATLGAPALRRELLALAAADQAARAALVPDASGTLVGAAGSVEDVDRRSTARLKEIVAQHGWPGIALVGEDGSHAAWVLVQHADADLAFQKTCLALLERAVASGDALAIDNAYLHDRVALHHGRKQRYGTQFVDGREPFPIEDEAHVDERRAAVGLPSLADGVREIREKYAR